MARGEALSNRRDKAPGWIYCNKHLKGVTQTFLADVQRLSVLCFISLSNLTAPAANSRAFSKKDGAQHNKFLRVNSSFDHFRGRCSAVGNGNKGANAKGVHAHVVGTVIAL